LKKSKKWKELERTDRKRNDINLNVEEKASNWRIEMQRKGRIN
jgi:hypothetical protein